jgi:hypothetical protein
MSRSRRSFLKHLGAGALGSGAVLLPTEALAFGRRRVRVIECPGEPVYCLPGCATRLAGFHISFPGTGGATPGTAVGIPGNGGFFTWGKHDPSRILLVSGVTAHNENGIQLAPSVQNQAPAPNTWAFRLSGLTPGTPFELRYIVQRVGSPTPPPPDTVPHRWFVCLNDHPF